MILERDPRPATRGISKICKQTFTNMAERKENENSNQAAISCYLRRTKLYLDIKKDLRVIISILFLSFFLARH